MEILKYKKIKNQEQYQEYCNKLEELCLVEKRTEEVEDEMEVLTILIEKFDEENSKDKLLDPIKMLKYLMDDNKLNASQIALMLGVSKGLISDILQYKKGLSKEVIRKLADHFKVRQEIFNRPYKLLVPLNTRLKNASVMNTQKIMN